MASKTTTTTAGRACAPPAGMSESDLRAWLRGVWPPSELVWVEAARGGTAGQPDVSIPVAGAGRGRAWRLPCELKHWHVNKHGIVRSHMRPAQVRFHTLEAAAGRRTCVLAAVGEDPACFDLVAIPGHAVPREPLAQIRGRWFRACGPEEPVTMRAALERLFNSETFWSR